MMGMSLYYAGIVIVLYICVCVCVCVCVYIYIYIFIYLFIFDFFKSSVIDSVTAISICVFCDTSTTHYLS